MSFKDILLEVRSMRRSAQIRNETDPNKVAAILEDLVKESVHLQSGGDKNFQKKSMAELKQIRRDLVAGQINAGDATGKMTVVYSSVIDSLSKIEADSTKSFQAYEKAASSLKSSIPSTDTLVSALMTANPLLGYGVKMVRDLARNGEETRKRAKVEAAKKLAVLRGQEKYLQEQFEIAQAEAEVVEQKAENAETEKKASGRKERSDKGVARNGPYKEVLTAIQSDIKELLNIWKDDPITTVDEAINELTQQTVENTKDQIAAAEELEDRRERAEAIDENKSIDTSENPIQIVDPVNANAVHEKKDDGGILGGIMKGIGSLLLSGFAGLFAAGGIFAAGGLLATMIKPFTGLIKFFTGIGSVALKLASKLALPVAVLSAIYDFFDAFFNASEFLNKPDSQIDIADRISLGIANIITGIVGMFDSLLELFGIDLIDTEGLTKKIYDFFWGFPDMVMKMLDDATAFITDIYGQVVESLKGQVDDVKSGLVDAYTDVVDRIMSVFNSITTTFKSVVETIEKKFSEWKQTISNIPGIGQLFSSDPTEPIQLDPLAVEQASQDLKDMTSSTNLLRLNEGVATMVPLETGSGAASTGVQRAEQQTQIPMKAPVMVNAPTSTVNNINQGGGAKSSNTSNQNHKFRRVADRT